MSKELLKDEVLDGLARIGNVAQFASFDLDLKLRFRQVHGEAGRPGTYWEDVVRELLEHSIASSVNVRSFRPGVAQGNEFIYGLTDVQDVITAARRLSTNGHYVIVNETIDVADGGVSGVVHGDAIEVAPLDTPRAVEKPGIASFSRKLGVAVLGCIYGFKPDIEVHHESRLEFSLHPLRVGVHHGHTLWWEMESGKSVPPTPDMAWPNRLSRFLGDKTFGLLLAAMVGLPVPWTQVFPRTLPPFSFGEKTGTGETWFRTAPNEQTPGLFSTARGWMDPFLVLAREDPNGDRIASVLSQEGVDARFAGAARIRGDSQVLVEGVRGSGAEFMVGAIGPDELPKAIVDDVSNLLEASRIGIRAGAIEWAHDGKQAWLLQVHQSRDEGMGRVIVPGSPKREVTFDVSEGLDGLRQLVDGLNGTETGVVLVGDVGVTSHFGDVLRQSGVPARLSGKT